MATLYSDASGVLIGVALKDEPLPGAAVSISFDMAMNQAVVEDVQTNASHYRLLPGPDLQKDGVSVTVDTTPSPSGIRRAIQILTDQEAAITAATTIGQIKTILEQDRTILRRLLIRMGDD